MRLRSGIFSPLAAMRDQLCETDCKLTGILSPSISSALSERRTSAYSWKAAKHKKIRQKEDQPIAEVKERHKNGSKNIRTACHGKDRFFRKLLSPRSGCFTPARLDSPAGPPLRMTLKEPSVSRTTASASCQRRQPGSPHRRPHLLFGDPGSPQRLRQKGAAVQQKRRFAGDQLADPAGADAGPGDGELHPDQQGEGQQVPAPG